VDILVCYQTVIIMHLLHVTSAAKRPTGEKKSDCRFKINMPQLAQIKSQN